MRRFGVNNNQYVVYANEQEEAKQILIQELDRVDKIKEKIASMLTKDGQAYQNFMENTSEENLNIYFTDVTSPLLDDPNNRTEKGIVVQRSSVDGKITYTLAYRYPEINGQNADFRLAHEMGHLVLNPSNIKMQTYDQNTDTRQVTGLIRVPKGQENNPNAFYGSQIQENAINLLAELAIRGEHSADDIIKGNVDVSEFNSYKKVDELVKLLAVSMRNDFDKEMSFEQLVENKLDSFIEHSDGTKEPANTFFYGLLNDSSMIENEFDKYMGKGAYRDLDTYITSLHRTNSQEQFNLVYKEAQEMIRDFANERMQEKHKEAVAREGENVPSLDGKVETINEMTGVALEQNNQTLSVRHKLAQILQRNNILMKIPFLQKFVSKQLNVLPPAVSRIKEQIAKPVVKKTLSEQLAEDARKRNPNLGRRMSDPNKIAYMQRQMEQKMKSTDEEER